MALPGREARSRVKTWPGPSTSGRSCQGASRKGRAPRGGPAEGLCSAWLRGMGRSPQATRYGSAQPVQEDRSGHLTEGLFSVRWASGRVVLRVAQGYGLFAPSHKRKEGGGPAWQVGQARATHGREAEAC